MPQPRPRALIESTFFGLAALCLIMGVWALGFSQEVSREDRALLIIASSVGLLTSFASLIFVRFLWKWLHKRTSRRVLSIWQESLKSQNSPTIDVAHYLSEGALRILAMQLFSRMGYGILNRDDEKDQGYVRMVNPDGQLELVACKQQADPVEIRPIYEFHLDLKRAGAVQGYYWAAGGFTSEAQYWVREKPILLADRYGIGHLIDCVQTHRSRFLD